MPTNMLLITLSTVEMFMHKGEIGAGLTEVNNHLFCCVNIQRQIVALVADHEPFRPLAVLHLVGYKAVMLQ